MSFWKRIFGGHGKASAASSDAMDKDGFWAIIDRARQGSKDPVERAELLQRELQSLAPERIIEFDGFYSDRLEEAFRWDLWGAAYVLRGGCGDDGFSYFQNWLIAEGRTVFEKALRDPDSLADLPLVEDAQNESFGYAAMCAYEELTGQEIPAGNRKCSSEPHGEPWEEDEVYALFPRLAEKYE